MLISIRRLLEGKVAARIVVMTLILILSAAALSGAFPVIAEAASFADATATWSDVPSDASSSAALDESSSTEPSVGHASWYVHPRYRKELMAASTQFPKGSKVRVTNLANNKTVIVMIKDWGPDPIQHPDRVIDLNKVAFQKIASARSGIIDVRVELASTSTVAIAGKN